MNKAKLKNKLDRLWRSYKKEDAVCEICASLPPSQRINYTQLQPHHIIGRTALATRWDLHNRLWVCPRHHTMGMWNETVQNNLGGWFLNWESDDDWMGKHRPEDKEHLRKLYKTVKQWTLDELEKLIIDFTN